MARVFTDGAEMGDTRFWDYAYAGNFNAVTVPAPVGGTYSYSGAWLGAYKVISPISELYFRFRLRASLAGPNGWSVTFRSSTNGTIGFSVDALNRFSIYLAGVLLEASDVVMYSDAWYLVEIHYLIDNAAGRVEVYLDGDLIIDFTGDTQSGAFTTVDNIYWDGSAYRTSYLDDLALNDTTGIVDNSWCGDGIITKMIPNGDGAHNNWTNSNGTSVDNWDYINEYPNDGDLTYIYANGVSSGLQDQQTLTDLDYTNKTVLRIYPEARARESAPSGYTLKLGILPNGGADDLSTGKVLPSGYYARIVGKEYLVNPVDSNPWEEVDLDSLQLIEEVG